MTDNSGLFTVKSSHISGSEFVIGVTVVTYTATDPSGNSAGFLFNVTVKGIYIVLIC